ncbi:MAG: folate-binding protein [Pseudomonadota bacterium]
MAELKGFADDTRAVLRMSGSDARSVLQNVVTNNVDEASDGKAVYAALLTPQGKYLFDFFLVGDGEDILIDTVADRAPDLMRRLGMYCLRRDATLREDKSLRVFLVWPGEGGSHPPPPPPSPGHAATVIDDPRDPALGWRIYGAAPPETAAGARAEYDALRVAHRIPESGRELLADETYILEAGFERLNGVDFRKGCYVGQEVTARMKHKTELRKGLVVVDVAGTAPEGTELMAAGKPAGKIFTQSGGRALAHLRFDRAGAEMEAGEARVRYTP